VIFSHLDSDALAAGDLVALAFAVAARATRSVWSYCSSTQGLEPLARLKEIWLATLDSPADQAGWRSLKRDGRRFWLVPNEVGGLTLMFSEDL